jgi:hypothetical protein
LAVDPFTKAEQFDGNVNTGAGNRRQTSAA